MANFEWYRSFVSVYRVGTVSGAAKALHLTQPAVSQHVAALEAAMGDRLFERLPRRMAPTAAGQRLYSQVAAAVEQLEAVSTQRQLSGSLQIRLGAPPEFFTEWMLPRLNSWDNVSVAVEFGLAKALVQRVAAAELDGAIATQKVTQPGIEFVPLWLERFWLVGPPRLSLPETIFPKAIDALSSSVDASERLNLTTPGRSHQELEAWLARQAWLSYGADLPIIRRFWRVVFKRRLTIEPRLILPNLLSLREAVALGLGITVLPDYLCSTWAEAQRLTVILQPEAAVTNQIWLAFRKGERSTQAVQQLLGLAGD